MTCERLTEEIRDEVTNNVGFMIELAFQNDEQAREELSHGTMADKIRALINEQALSFETMRDIIFDALWADEIDYFEDYWPLMNAAEKALQ